MKRRISASDKTLPSRSGKAIVRFAAGCVLGLAVLGRTAFAIDCTNWNEPGYFAAISLATLTECLRRGADPNAVDEEGWTPLRSVVANNDRGSKREAFALKAVMALLDAGADPNLPTASRYTPLVWALLYENPAVTVALLETGADPNAPSGGGSPLIRAVRMYRTPHASALLAHGADVQNADASGRTALHHAVRAILREDIADSSLVRLLLKAGAEPNATDDTGRTPLHMASESVIENGVAVALLEAGATSDLPDSQGNTPLFYAVRAKADRSVFVALLASGADPNFKNRRGFAPIHLAAESSSDPKVIRILVDAGADPNLPTNEALYPLHLAAGYNSEPGIVSALLEGGADPFIADTYDWLPLVWANALNTNPEVAAMLLDAHAVAASRQQSSPSRPIELPGLRKVKCWFSGQMDLSGVECFYMFVREDLDNQRSPLIGIPIIRFFDPNSETHIIKTPILDIGGGGPGSGSGFENDISVYRSNYLNLAKDSGRDYYVMDTRGVGMAYPRLRCGMFFGPARNIVGDYATLQEEIDVWMRIYEECKKWTDRLGYDLSHYNSQTVAKDVEQIRAALDTDKLVLMGYSYGGRYALTVARDFPQSVESMILFASRIPGLSWQKFSLNPSTMALKKLFSYCKKVRLCDSKILENRFDKLFQDLQKGPKVLTSVTQKVSDNYDFTIDVHEVILTGNRLIDIITSNLYDRESFDNFPRLIEELERGEERIIRDMVPQYLHFWFDTSFSDSIYWSHLCSEEYSFLNFDDIEKKSLQNLMYARNWWYLREYWQRACRIWDVPPADAIEGRMVTTSIPTLFLHGALDHAALVEEVQVQLPNFENGEALIFADETHWSLEANECALAAAAYFVEHRQLEDKHRSCAVEIPEF